MESGQYYNFGFHNIKFADILNFLPLMKFLPYFINTFKTLLKKTCMWSFLVHHG